MNDVQLMEIVRVLININDSIADIAKTLDNLEKRS